MPRDHAQNSIAGSGDQPGSAVRQPPEHERPAAMAEPLPAASWDVGALRFRRELVPTVAGSLSGAPCG
jgi:hypothetical protein